MSDSLVQQIPLYTLDGRDWLGGEYLNQLESFIGARYTCACSSVQIALQSCLELMGTRTDMIPVVMPVTAAPDALSAVLRAGGRPMLLDIDENTLQMDPEQMKVALEELEVAIIFFTRPGGMPVDDRLIELAKDYPSIVDSRLAPHPDMGSDDLPAVFNVFDLTSVCGGGGVIVHKFKEQVAQLKIVRSGVMGHAGALSELQAQHALQELKKMPEYQAQHQQTASKIIDSLKAQNLSDILPYAASKWPSPLYIWVPNAYTVAAHLNSYGFETLMGVYPLCRLAEVRRRYIEEPEYPMAEKLMKEVICVPTHKGVVGYEQKFAEWIGEIQ